MLSYYMPLLILRPFLTAVLEYFLAFKVFKKHGLLPITTTLFLVALATYQFGEFLFFLDMQNRVWLAISLFSTTMLPPYGLLLIEKLSHRKTFYMLFFIASLLFGLTFVFIPSVIPAASECNCFAKLNSSSLEGLNLIFFRTWGWYYFLSLALSMLLISWHIIKRHGDTKNLTWLFWGYLSFFPASFFLIYATNSDTGIISSVMCALAIFTAFIVTHISADNKKLNSKVAAKNQNKKAKLLKK